MENLDSLFKDEFCPKFLNTQIYRMFFFIEIGQKWLGYNEIKRMSTVNFEITHNSYGKCTSAFETIIRKKTNI